MSWAASEGAWTARRERCFPVPKGTYRTAGKGLYTRECSGRARSHSFKLRESRLRLDIRNKFFPMRMMRWRSRLPRGFVSAPSLEVLQASLNGCFGQLDLVENNPAHGREHGTAWFLRSLSTEIIPWFCDEGVQVFWIARNVARLCSLLSYKDDCFHFNLSYVQQEYWTSFCWRGGSGGEQEMGLRRWAPNWEGCGDGQ